MTKAQQWPSDSDWTGSTESTYLTTMSSFTAHFSPSFPGWGSPTKWQMNRRNGTWLWALTPVMMLLCWSCARSNWVKNANKLSQTYINAYFWLTHNCMLVKFHSEWFGGTGFYTVDITLKFTSWLIFFFVLDFSFNLNLCMQMRHHKIHINLHTK